MEISRCHIVLILWTLATTISTTSSDNIKQIDNNKNLPRYLYKYSIGNEDGVGQGKIETTSGELANGQYYINNNQSLTDVKYFVDKWGYHPIVKYSTSNSHGATSSAHLAFDNYPIYKLINTTDNGNRNINSANIESNILPELHSLKSLQPPISNNPNIFNQSTSTTSFISNVNNIDSTNDTVFERPKLTNNPNEYETIIKLLNTNNSKREDETPINYSIDDSNDGKIETPYSATITENILLKESAGIFGQRLQQNIIHQLNETNRINPELSYTAISIADENNSAIQPETSSQNYKSALENLRKYLRLNNGSYNGLNNATEFQTRTESPNDNGNKSEPQVQLPQLSNDTTVKSWNSPHDFRIESEIELLDDITSLKPETTVKFSRPIIVAEISNIEHANYSSIFPCNEDNVELIPSSTIDINSSSITHESLSTQITQSLTVTPKLQREAHLTTSSIVLNPIRAGVALVNGGKTHLIVGNVELSPTAIVNENTPIDTNQQLEDIVDNETSQLSNIPSNINPIFGKYETSTTNAQTSSLADDKTVEIQKSLELYHSSPVQEIHYPAQLMPQVTSVDQQQRQQPYQTTQKHENAKLTYERSIESYKEDIDLTSRNSNTIKNRSIANPSILGLSGHETAPEGNDLSTTYVTDNGRKVNGNNVVHFKRPVENYVIQHDHSSISTSQETSSDNKNLFVNTKLNTELYLPYESKHFYGIVQPTQSQSSDIVNDESMKRDTSVFTMKMHPRTRSLLQRLLTESSDVVHYPEFDKLNNRDKHLHQQHPPSANEFGIASERDSTKAEINLTKQRIPIFRSEQYTDGASAIDTIITSMQSQIKPTNNKLLSDIDDKTLYIYTTNIDSKMNNMKNSEDSLGNSVGKFIDNSVGRGSVIRPYSNRIVERRVPYAIQPYPIASADKIIEKKVVPYPIHKLVDQSYPIHIFQPYTVEKSANIPAVTYNNAFSRNTHIPHRYPVSIPIKFSYPVELLKYSTEKSIQMPYDMQYGSNYQHVVVHQRNHKLYNKHEVNSFKVPFSANISNQNSQDYIHVKPVIPFVNLPSALSKRYSSLNQFTNNKQYYPQLQFLNYKFLSKKSYSSQLPFQTYTTANVNHPTPLLWHVTHRTGEKFIKKNMGYLRSQSLVQHALNVHQPNQMEHPIHQDMFEYSTGSPADANSFLRRARFPERHYHGNTGNFRQSKMEYGFKPPMVPSIQYDEQMATKIQS